MKTSNALACAVALLLAFFIGSPTILAVVHKSIFTTIDLSVKQPLDTRSSTKLVSISPDGVVKIQVGDNETYTARAGESFVDAKGRGPHLLRKLISVNPAKDAVVISYETRVYLKPPPPPAKPNKVK
jgi:hypothetical protein